MKSEIIPRDLQNLLVHKFVATLMFFALAAGCTPKPRPDVEPDSEPATNERNSVPENETAPEQIAAPEETSEESAQESSEESTETTPEESTPTPAVVAETNPATSPEYSVSPSELARKSLESFVRQNRPGAQQSWTLPPSESALSDGSEASVSMYSTTSGLLKVFALFKNGGSFELLRFTHKLKRAPGPNPAYRDVESFDFEAGRATLTLTQAAEAWELLHLVLRAEQSEESSNPGEIVVRHGGRVHAVASLRVGDHALKLCSFEGAPAGIENEDYRKTSVAFAAMNEFAGGFTFASAQTISVLERRQFDEHFRVTEAATGVATTPWVRRGFLQLAARAASEGLLPSIIAYASSGHDAETRMLALFAASKISGREFRYDDEDRARPLDLASEELSKWHELRIGSPLPLNHGSN
ncbi:MAG: hypothetical protein NUW37_19205 [Planctomycetes bacterium]|nr:hypothetical protein [Planctomycetota bacterium]